MPTTPPSSEAARLQPPTGARALACCCGLLLTVGCATPTDPASLFELPPDSPAMKAMQNRRFETKDLDELLSASAAVLQDLGFQISESARDLGFLRATKERSAREYGQEITRGVVLFLSVPLTVLSRGNSIIILPVDLHQQINASLVAQPLGPSQEGSGESGEDGALVELRIVFYRLVWKGDGQSGNQYQPPGEQRMEMVRDPEIYQQFFARLHKSIFLEAQKI